MNPKDQLTAIQKSMTAVVEHAKAAQRDLTDAEMDSLEARATEAHALKAKIERGERSKALFDRAFGVSPDRSEPTGNGAKNHAAATWAQKAVDNLATLASRSPSGAKALTSGSVAVPSILSPALIESHPRTLLDLIPVIDPNRPGMGIARPDDDGVDFVSRTVGRVGNVYSFLRQSTRLSNAGAVPDGAEKPTSTYSFGQVDDTFRVYANKTEDLAWRYLDDFSDLIEILKVQLRDDTLTAIERDVLSGDGEDDRFTGILNTSGLQIQEYMGDLLSTLSTAKYKLLGQERAISGWALNPLDLQALEMLRENGTNGAFLFKSRSEIEGFLGAPVVTSLGLPVGEAVVADWNQAELLPVGDDELVFDGKNRTENNTFRLMFEGRYGFRVKKPFDFVRVSLAQ